MKRNKFIMGITVVVMIASLIMPGLVLCLLEDHHIKYGYDVSPYRFDPDHINKESILIKTIYSKYNDEKYTISTRDTFEYAQPYIEIDGTIYRNEPLIRLKELEAIGLIQNAFFKYVETNQNMISRVNEFRNENMHYEKIRISLPDDHYENAFMAFEIEKSTDKIISLKMPKKYVTCTRDVMDKYIQYLGLTQNDWVYENRSVHSSENGLEIKTEEIHHMMSITIVPYNEK